MGEFTDLIFTVLGKLGRWMNVQGKRACFILWGLGMVYWIMRNVQLGLKVQAAGCLFSLAMHLYGFWNWKRKEIGK